MEMVTMQTRRSPVQLTASVLLSALVATAQKQEPFLVRSEDTFLHAFMIM